MKVTLEKTRDHFQDKLWKLMDNFGAEKHPEKIEACKLILELIEKAIPKEPRTEGLADRYCPTCRAWIKFDALNVPIEHAPKRCEECGQLFTWEGGET
jgi:predicted Zn finger-like uncharacterized protein